MSRAPHGLSCECVKDQREIYSYVKYEDVIPVRYKNRQRSHELLLKTTCFPL